ncbi:MAG: CAP domain-containing protein, partial [bacterium]|nr:CAP domain-containing protein [bacterium]
MKLFSISISKKVLIGIVVAVLTIGGAITSVVLLNNKTQENNSSKVKKEETIKTISIKDDLEFEINSALTLLSLIEDDNNLEITTEDEKVDTSKLGKKNITITYLDNKKKEQKYKFQIMIVDTTNPVIEYQEEHITTVGTEIDLTKDVKVIDNSKEEITVTVEGVYDINKEGEYQLKYVAVDSSENKTEKDFTLKVNAKPTISQDNKNSNTNKSETTTSTNKNKNSTTKTNTNPTNTTTTTSPNNNTTTNSNNSTSPSNNTNQQQETPNSNTNNTVSPPVKIAEYRQSEANKMITLINQARAENGLSSLSVNSSLESSAKIRAKEIITLFSHTRPNQTNFFSAISISYHSVGENIAAGHSTCEGAFEGWMNSPGHRANILS